MSITKEKIEEIANLARIKLTEKEKMIYVKQFASILGYFEQLKEVDTENAKPLINANSATNIMREDDIKERDPSVAQNILEQFPEKKGNYLKVKKIMQGA